MNADWYFRNKAVGVTDSPFRKCVPSQNVFLSFTLFSPLPQQYQHGRNENPYTSENIFGIVESTTGLNQLQDELKHTLKQDVTF